MIRRAYCIRCGHLHRRDPDTWTNRACRRCAGEVRFSGGRKLKEELVITIRLLPDDRALLAADAARAVDELRAVLLAYVARLHGRAARRGMIPPRATIELERRSVTARKH
jgi:hypothetical protein